MLESRWTWVYVKSRSCEFAEAILRIGGSYVLKSSSWIILNHIQNAIWTAHGTHPALCLWFNIMLFQSLFCAAVEELCFVEISSNIQPWIMPGDSEIHGDIQTQQLRYFDLSIRLCWTFNECRWTCWHPTQSLLPCRWNVFTQSMMLDWTTCELLGFHCASIFGQLNSGGYFNQDSAFANLWVWGQVMGVF